MEQRPAVLAIPHLSRWRTESLAYYDSGSFKPFRLE